MTEASLKTIFKVPVMIKVSFVNLSLKVMWKTVIK